MDIKTRYLKAMPTKLEGGNVDKEKGIIKSVILAQTGEAKGHGMHLDGDFISDSFNYAAQNWGEAGLKCRFGHPSMSNDALGTEVGRFYNFSKNDTQLKADLHLFESANLSPTHTGAKDWLLSMAEESPDSIMCSIVFKPKDYYQFTDGEREYDQDKWDDKQSVFVELDELTHTDIVDEGAVTDKLFSSELNSDKFAVIASKFLDEHPQIFEFIKEQPEKIPGFLELYNNYNLKVQNNSDMENKENITLSGRITKALNILKGGELEEVKEVQELEAKNEGLEGQIEALNTKVDTIEKYFNAQLAEKNEEIEELKKSNTLVAEHLEFIAKNTKSEGFEDKVDEFENDTLNKVSHYKSADEILRDRRNNKN